MKKVILFFSLLLGIHLGTFASIKDLPDTLNKKPIPFLSIGNTNAIEFTAVSSGTYSILIESNGGIIEIDEVNLSVNEVYSIDMSTLPAGAYRVVITDIIRGIEYEYFYRKEDNTEMI